MHDMWDVPVGAGAERDKAGQGVGPGASRLLSGRRAGA